MKIRFYIDSKTGTPHIHRHGVREHEAEDVLSNPGEDRPGKEGSRIAIGQTMGVICESSMCQTQIPRAFSSLPHTN